MKLFVSITSVASLLLVAGIAGTIIRINQLEKGELFRETEPQTLSELSAKPGATSISARLDSVRLKAGEQVIFEICSTDRLSKHRWEDAVEFAVLDLDKMKLMFKTPLDQKHLEMAKRNDEGACLVLGGGQIEYSGRYSIEAVWHDKRPSNEVMRVGLYVRVQARSPLVAWDRYLVVAIAIGAMLLVLVRFFAPASKQRTATIKSALESSERPRIAQRSGNESRLRILLIAILCVTVIWALIGWLPLFGSSMSFYKGLLLAATEGGLAFWLARRLGLAGTRIEHLALFAPVRFPIAGITLSVLLAGALVAIARSALWFVPSTSEAPIQTFIAWPSGMLCFAALGVVVPLGEEVFFRGFLYRALLSYGRVAAFAITIVSFVGLHLQQVWGNWGGLVALVAAGTVLTALRAYSGSTLLPAVTHLLYNFVLSYSSL